METLDKKKIAGLFQDSFNRIAKIQQHVVSNPANAEIALDLLTLATSLAIIQSQSEKEDASVSRLSRDRDVVAAARSRYSEMLVWGHEHRTSHQAALRAALTHGSSDVDDFTENAFRAIAADLEVLSFLIESESDLSNQIVRLFIDGVATRAQAAAGYTARRSDSESSLNHEAAE